MKEAAAMFMRVEDGWKHLRDMPGMAVEL